MSDNEIMSNPSKSVAPKPATTIPQANGLTTNGVAPRVEPGRTYGIDVIQSKGVVPRHELTTSDLSFVQDAWGNGGIRFKENVVTRMRGNSCQRDEGVFFYCRDLSSNEYWSLGYSPTRAVPDAYECRFAADEIEISRVDHKIASQLHCSLLPDSNALLMRCTLTNMSSQTRCLELTSYQELVMQPSAAHESHPAFSKLFLETAWNSELATIHARRRPRDSRFQFPELAHFLATDAHARDRWSNAKFETCRKAFIGRGRSLARPQAMDASHDTPGHIGSVLDPIASLRVCCNRLEPGETQSVTFVTAIADSREQLRREATAVRLSLGDSFSPHTHNAKGTNGALGSDPVSSSFASQCNAPPSEQANQNHTTTEQRLKFDNGLGGFSNDGSEYCIRVATDEHGNRKLPPMPWCNVIANDKVGFIISEQGSSSTWANNSREFRLTAWENDPVCDRPSDAIYIRDEDSSNAAFWSAMPSPAPHDGDYLTRHGFGYTVMEHFHRGIAHEVTSFVPCDDACRVTRVRLANQTDDDRTVSVFAYHDWVLGSSKQQTQYEINSRWDDELQTHMATRHPSSDFCQQVAFSATFAGGAATNIGRTNGWDIVATWQDSNAFLGNQDIDRPAAVLNREGGISEPELGSPCAATQARVTIPAGQFVDVIFLLGVADSRDEIGELCDKYAFAGNVTQSLAEVREFWQNLLGRLQIDTPSDALNLLVNGWLVYQNLSCRMWARSAFYQGGGAFGFRDQLQDSAAFMLQRPSLTRSQILLHAAHQFEEGDVMHWWHPPHDLGIRTRFADDLLWLPLIAAEYVAATGDTAIWDEEIPFLTARALEDNEDEALLVPTPSGNSGSLLEHCCRAIDRSLPTGKHGLPLMGSGDWNDGMNRIGSKGIGESVWMGFFLYHAIDLFLPTLADRNETERHDRFTAAKDALRIALNSNGWDGDWFKRAFHDDGTTIGSATSEECRIDALAQAWSVISGAGDKEKQSTAVDSADRQLVDTDAALIKLLDPPFHDCDVDPGYIKGYLPGIRENGGQYTHGILWLIKAMAMLGRGDRATQLIELINPIGHGSTPNQVATYQTEPYVVAADVYSVAPHQGRGGWTWYTGSAGWMFRIAVEEILGVKLLNGEMLIVDPRVSRNWDQFSMRLTLPTRDVQLMINFHNPDRRESGVRSASINGTHVPIESSVARIRIPSEGNVHSIEIRM